MPRPARLIGVDPHPLWALIWPRLLAIVALRVLAFPLAPGWNPSLVPAPGVSLFDAVILAWTGWDVVRRTRNVTTALVIAAIVSAAGYAIFMLYAALRTPGLLLAPFQKPFIFVILVALLALAVGFGIVFSAAGAMVARWSNTAPPLARLDTAN